MPEHRDTCFILVSLMFISSSEIIETQRVESVKIVSLSGFGSRRFLKQFTN